MNLLSRTTILALLCVYASGYFASAMAATGQFDMDQVDEIFADYLDPLAPCCSLAVYQNGKVLFSKSYGLANLEYGIPNSPDSVFHIASLSKQLTAFSILLLEDEGKLSLDDDIRKYLPEMPVFGSTVTIRNLLNHTSGIRDQWDLLLLAGFRDDDLKSNADIYRLLKRQRELNFEPGERFLYSNSGYTLLALIVEHLSGQDFRRFTQQRIFNPLGMHNTHFHDNHNEIVPNRAYAYEGIPNGGFERSIPVFNTVGATSLFSTINDFARWDRNFEDPIVGNQSVITKLLTRGQLNNNAQISYASGLGITEYKGLEMISHTGADAGYRALYARFPDQDTAVAIFANTPIDVQSLAFKVVDIVLADALVEPIQKLPDQIETNNFVDIGDEISTQRAGPYRDTSDSTIWHLTRSPQVDSMVLSANGKHIEMRPLDENTYTPIDTAVNAKMVFTNTIEGKTSLQVFFDEQEVFRGTRLVEIQDIQVYAQTIAGTFYSPELDVRYEIEAMDGRMILRHFKLREISLHATHEDVLLSDSGLLAIEIVRNNDGLVSGFKANTGRVVGLKFVKEF